MKKTRSGSIKLVVMIPCLNEEKTLKSVISSIPKKITGVGRIEILVIDDGSTDKTLKVARALGVSHFVIHHHNQGLAKAFADGLDKALELGADIIVNTDGDNQYPQKDIPRLIYPILSGKADMVVGNRQTDTIKHFSWSKKWLQKFGTTVVRFFSGTNVSDAASGFRAYSREMALHINIFTDYTYTMETLIQAGKKKFQIVSVPIKTRKTLRKSRLIKSYWSYLKTSTATILRIFAIYEPLKVFSYISFIIMLPGWVLMVRFLFFFFEGNGAGHLQSLIVGTLFVLTGFQIGVFGLMADLIAINRRKMENVLTTVKKMKYDKKS